MDADFSRPDPDLLLKNFQRSESGLGKGKLRVFLGMAPGVGKTYAMLEAARSKLREGLSVSAGIIETHGRSDTAALAEDIPTIPRKKIPYNNTTLQEFDLDAAITQKPPLILVDELAHTNAPGSRHTKRWQDIVELLDQGINVWTTLNVQHLESQSDVVASFTGAPVRETVPDSILEMADEISVIDLTPTLLRQRLKEGKVYLPDRALAAAENFFREGNLTALRELTLRVAAQKVGQNVRDFLQSKQITGPWKSGARLMVAVSPSPYSLSLVRFTARTAQSLDASWVAVHVDKGTALSESDQLRVENTLSTARQLGGEVYTTSGINIVNSLIRIARQQNVTHIVVGKSFESRLRAFLQGGTLADKIIRCSGDIDIFVVHADKESNSQPQKRSFKWPLLTKKQFALPIGLLILLSATMILLSGILSSNAIALIYLMSVLGIGLYSNRLMTFIYALVSALVWEFFFTLPLYSFKISNFEDIIIFLCLLISALVVGHLSHSIKAREKLGIRREEQAQALLRITRLIAWSTTFEQAMAAASRFISDFFHVEVSLLLADKDNNLSIVDSLGESSFVEEKEKAVARWAFDNNKPAGKFTDTLRDSSSLFLPLATDRGSYGVLCVKPRKETPLHLSGRQLMQDFAAQIALAIERHSLEEIATRTLLSEESDKLQRALFDSLSHEMKTPLTIIASATDQLEGMTKSAESKDRKIIEEIKSATSRLLRLVDNLLNMARLEFGTLQPSRDWCNIRDIVNGILPRFKGLMDSRNLTIDCPADLPPVRLDSGLIEEIVANLLLNAIQHTTKDSRLLLSVKLENKLLRLIVEDNGNGLTEPDKVFEKFYRAANARSGGIGLGLSIVKGFVEAHGGKIRAENATPSGARFIVDIPAEISEYDTLP